MRETVGRFYTDKNKKEGGMKRYCQTLSLKDNEELIASYISVHEKVWPEVQDRMKQGGILDMQIYIHGNLLFMIVDTVDDFDWEVDMSRLAGLPGQAEWERHVARFQDVDETASSMGKWVLMNKIFDLEK